MKNPCKCGDADDFVLVPCCEHMRDSAGPTRELMKTMDIRTRLLLPMLDSLQTQPNDDARAQMHLLINLSAFGLELLEAMDD